MILNPQITIAVAMLLDMITTIVGLLIGLVESNPMGVSLVFILNTIAIIFFYIKRRESIPKWGQIIIYMLALYRLIVVCWNVYLIIKVI